MDKIPLSTVAEWLKHPVTEAYLRAIDYEKQDLADRLAKGACFHPTMSVNDMYSQFMGNLAALNAVMNAKDLMIAYDLVEEPKDVEEKK